MTRLPGNQQHQPRPPAPPEPRRRRFQPRWPLLLIVAVILLMAWVLHNVAPSVTWEEVLDEMNVPRRSRERYTQLATLGLFLCGTCAVVRVLRK